MARAPRPVAVVLAFVLPAVAAAVYGAGVARAATVSAPDSSSEAAFASKIAAERSSRGLPAIRVFDDLTSVARNHSEQMAAQQKLSDDTNLASEVQNWQSLGGNAGEGPSVDQVHQAFMASPSHRANILDPNFTDVGVGVVWTGGTLWVTEVFRQPATSTAAAASALPPPAPPSTTKASPPATPATAATSRPAVRPTAPPPTPAPPTVTAPPAPPTTPPVLLTAGAVPPPDRFAMDSADAADPPGNGGHALVALGAPIVLTSPRRVPLPFVAVALALLLLDLVALAAARGTAIPKL